MLISHGFAFCAWSSTGLQVKMLLVFLVMISLKFCVSFKFFSMTLWRNLKTYRTPELYKERYSFVPWRAFTNPWRRM